MPAGPTQAIEFVLNGELVSVSPDSPQTTLLDVLRDRGLTGAKEGCAEGECGACMVLCVTRRDQQSAYRPVNSCLMFAPMAAGHEVYTVESLAEDGELCEAQAAMASAGGSQCGYCTPGFVISLFAEQYRPERYGPCDPHALAGNLCRCTGYSPIRDAALSLGDAPKGAFRDRLSRPAPRLGPAAFEADSKRFERPATLDECLAILAERPQARLIAGATDLGVESNLRFRGWPHLVSVEAIPELQAFEDRPESIRIGAALPLTDIELLWKNAPEIVRQWMPWFASPPLRNRATLGGNLATASPIGDGAPMLLALDASVHLASVRGYRSMPLTAFFTDYRRTALEPGEMIVAIEIPKPLSPHSRFYKIAKRRMDDISTVAGAISVELDTAGRVARARYALGGVAATPIRAYTAEEALVGERVNDATIGRAQAALEKSIKPISDHRGSAEFRVEVAKSLIEKFFWERTEAAA